MPGSFQGWIQHNFALTFERLCERKSLGKTVTMRVTARKSFMLVGEVVEELI